MQKRITTLLTALGEDPEYLPNRREVAAAFAAIEDDARGGPAGRTVTFADEQIIGGIRFDPGIYEVRLISTAIAPRDEIDW